MGNLDEDENDFVDKYRKEKMYSNPAVFTSTLFELAAEHRKGEEFDEDEWDDEIRAWKTKDDRFLARRARYRLFLDNVIKKRAEKRGGVYKKPSKQHHLHDPLYFTDLWARVPKELHSNKQMQDVVLAMGTNPTYPMKMKYKMIERAVHDIQTYD